MVLRSDTAENKVLCSKAIHKLTWTWINFLDSGANFITKWGKHYYKVRQLIYKFGKSYCGAGNLSQCRVTVLTKWGRYDKVGNFITKWGSYYKAVQYNRRGSLDTSCTIFKNILSQLMALLPTHDKTTES